MKNAFGANKFVKLTKHIFKNHPLLANSCTGFFVFSVGDIVAQAAAPKGKEFDYKRPLYTGVLGIAMNGFGLHGWFRILD